MGEETQNFLKAWLVIFASLTYAYFITSKLPKGKFRVLSLLPIFSLFTILPLSLSRPIPTTILSWFITWLANFKLLLYCFDHGPLSTQNTFSMFILLASFPIKLKGKDPPNHTRPEKVIPPNNWVKSLFFALFIYIYDRTKNWVMYGFALYLFIDICFAICTFFLAPLGLELEEPSDEPFASSSLQDFWGRRWNRMVSDALRDTIYFPVKSFCVSYMGRNWAQAVGTMASFTVSGLIHELMYYDVIRVKPTWEVTCFFVLQGLCVVLEVAVKRKVGWKRKLHWAITGPLTVTFVMTMGYWLFYLPLYRNHVDTKSIEDVKAFVKNLKKVFI
ncbi:unnamed protein product [Amaranthus hypochondriacus]